MRILIVSFYFPPANTMGAIAVAETAKYLRLAGDEVEVLTAAEATSIENLDMPGLDGVRVHRTGWRDVNRPLDRLRRGSDGRPQPGHAITAGGAKRAAASTYQNIVHLPDSKVGWYPSAVRQGRRVVDQFRPDVILASGPPATGYLIAAALTRHARATHPTVFCAHFRDPWSGNALSSAVPLRRRLDRAWQRRTLADADIVLANDAGHGNELAAELERPVIHWPNAFDEHDYLGERHPRHDGLIQLLHTGSVYPRVQDVDPLFEALAQLDAGTPIRMTFHGTGLDHVVEAARRHGISHLVQVLPSVPKVDAARKQMNADVLVLFAPRETNWLLGKVFAYAGARRPVWAIGPPTNTTSELVATEQLGSVLSHRSEISRALHELVANGPADSHPRDHAAQLSRQRRVADLRALLGARSCASVPDTAADRLVPS